MTREQIISKMVGAAKGCYNHYSDQPLEENVTDRLRYRLNLWLGDVKTTEWQATADAYDARVAAEGE